MVALIIGVTLFLLILILFILLSTLLTFGYDDSNGIGNECSCSAPCPPGLVCVQGKCYANLGTSCYSNPTACRPGTRCLNNVCT